MCVCVCNEEKNEPTDIEQKKAKSSMNNSMYTVAHVVGFYACVKMFEYHPFK